MFGEDFIALEERLKKAWQGFENTQPSAVVAKVRQKMQVSKDLLFEVILEEKQVSEFSFVISILDGTLQEDLFKLLKELGVEDPAADKDVLIEVLPHGELLGTGKYEALDYHWVEPFIAWLETYSHEREFPTSVIWLEIPDKAKISIFGDWGGGVWEGNDVARKISEHIQNEVQPDYSIHLGDVYYVGWGEEEKNHLLKYWPKAQKANFTLNSNHEMYPKGQGYFETALTNELFLHQQQTSYFALENKLWVIVGLDSAFNADINDLYLFGNLNAEQIDFLHKVKATKKNVIVLSHHNALSVTGNEKVPASIHGDVNKGLWNQVHDVLGAQLKYWYWGHAHIGAVYKPYEGVNCRVLGHGVVPWGNASALEAETVEWYENTPVDGTRVQNGFAVVNLNDEEIIEGIYGEDGLQHWPELT